MSLNQSRIMEPRVRRINDEFFLKLFIYDNKKIIKKFKFNEFFLKICKMNKKMTPYYDFV